MSWTALVPWKGGLDRKSRLAKVLSPGERVQIALHMAEHVIATLRAAPCIAELSILSPEREAALGDVSWTIDRGRGLNDELDRVLAAAGGRLLVVHADLPFLSGEDVAALIAAAEIAGAAIAPDRHDAGTNALAIPSAAPGFRYGFGADSFRRHVALLAGAAQIRRPGLALDIDTPDDILIARRIAPERASALLL